MVVPVPFFFSVKRASGMPGPDLLASRVLGVCVCCFLGMGEAHKEVIWQSCITLICLSTEINALLGPPTSPEPRDGGGICGYVILDLALCILCPL